MAVLDIAYLALMESPYGGNSRLPDTFASEHRLRIQLIIQFLQCAGARPALETPLFYG
jgi:hypothetical protein